MVRSLHSLTPTFSAKGLDHIAENILSYLDADSLQSAEQVCREWYRVISDGMLWKKLIERMVTTDNLWKGLAERRGWSVRSHMENTRSHLTPRSTMLRLHLSLSLSCTEL